MIRKNNFMAHLFIRLKLGENHFYFRGRSRFKKEDRSDKEMLFQIKVKKYDLKLPHCGNFCQGNLWDRYWK